ncbi:hypothetical protein LCGC14_2887930, partial [marine sediment metagenome]
MLNRSVSLFIVSMGVLILLSCATSPMVSKGVKNDSAILARAFQVAQTIEDPYNRDVAIEKIAGVFSAAGQFDDALKTTKAIVDPKIKAFALSTLSKDAWERGKKEKAIDMLTQSFEVIKTIEDPHMKSYFLATEATKFDKIGQKDKSEDFLSQAIEIADTISYDSIKAYNFTIIGDKYLKIGDKDKAGEILSKAYAIAQNIDDVSSQITIMDMIAGILAEDEQYEQAFQIAKAIEEIITKGAAPDRIADIYVTEGKYDEAVKTAQAIENSYTKTFALAVVIEASLSYLGLGTQPPTPSWGLMLKDAKNYLIQAPWMVIYP